MKPADKRFTTIKHEFEIVLKKNTAILRYEGDDLHIPMIQFDFSMISDIGFKENGSVTGKLLANFNYLHFLNLRRPKLREFKI